MRAILFFFLLFLFFYFFSFCKKNSFIYFLKTLDVLPFLLPRVNDHVTTAKFLMEFEHGKDPLIDLLLSLLKNIF